jgi:hypothetical protein
MNNIYYCSRHQAHLLSPRQSSHSFNLALQPHGGSQRTMELTVPPMAHDASTHLEWKHRRSPPPHRLRFWRHPSGVSAAGSGILFAGTRIWNCRAILIVPDPIRPTRQKKTRSEQPDTRRFCIFLLLSWVGKSHTRQARVGWPNGPKPVRTDLCPALIKTNR